MALIHNDQVEEVAGILPVETGSSFVLGNRLIDGEIDLTALVDLSVFNFPAGIVEGSEGFILGIINQDVAVGKVEDLGTTVLARPVPAGIPQLPANLEGDNGLTRTGRHRQQDAAFPPAESPARCG